MNLLPGAKIYCPFSVLERVQIIEDFLEEMYENFVCKNHRKLSVLENWRGVRIRGVSVWRGSTV